MIEYLEQKGTGAENGESTLGISSKSNDADFCTAIDIQNEDLVTKALSSKFPKHQIIGEESTGTDKPTPLTNDPTWIIDPIDGKYTLLYLKSIFPKILSSCQFTKHSTIFVPLN